MSPRKRTPALATALAMLVMLAMSPLGFLISPGVAHAASIYYVNCAASTNGNGTQTNPWNGLAPVSSFAFNPGDTVLFSRGTTCTGTLQLQRSGTSGSPITLAAYGTGATPVIDGTGQQAAVQLINTSYVTVQDLDIRNSTRWGLYATTSVKGIVTGITLRDLTVHDVTGGTLDQKWTGLVVFAPGLLGSRFDHVLIDAVSAYSTTMWAGIMVYGTQITGDPAWQTDAQDISQHSTNITIQNSTVHDTYGDGIVCYMCNGATLQHDVVYRSGMQPAPVTLGTPDALWTWASNNTVVQFNEAYDNHSPGVDGGAYDIDYYSQNATIQYNYAHDNQAYCVSAFGANGATTAHAIIRYNVCANNGTKGSGSGAEEIYIKTWSGGALSDLEIYNNTIYTTAQGAVGTDHTQPTVVVGSPLIFENNLVVSTVPNVLGAGMTSIPFTRDYNLYDYTGGYFSGTETHSIYNQNPLLNDLGYDGAGRPTTQWTLQAGSPAINAGTNVCNGRSGCSAGTQDFYGHSIPMSGPFDIGADYVPSTAPPGTPTNTPTPSPTLTPTPSAGTLFSDGFESGDFSAWSQVTTAAGGSATVQSNLVQSGSFAVQLAETATSGSVAYVRKTLASAQPSLRVSADVQLTTEGPAGSNSPLLRLFDASSTRLVNLYRANGSGAVWIGHSGGYYRTSGTVALRTWTHVELYVQAAGSGVSTVEAWLNGSLIYQSTTASLGSAGVLKVQIGNESASQPFTQVVDNVLVTT